MKKFPPVLRPVALLGIGLILAVLSAAVGTVSSDVSGNNLLAAAQRLQTTSPTPTVVTENTSKIGSTDGIVLMGIVIVLIIAMPILLRQKTRAK